MPNDFSNGEASFTSASDSQQEIRTIEQIPPVDRAYFADIIAAAEEKRRLGARQEKATRIVQPTRERLRSSIPGSYLIPFRSLEALKDNNRKAKDFFLTICNYTSQDELITSITSGSYTENELSIDVRFHEGNPDAALERERLPIVVLNRGGNVNLFKNLIAQFMSAGIRVRAHTL